MIDEQLRDRRRCWIDIERCGAWWTVNEETIEKNELLITSLKTSDQLLDDELAITFPKNRHAFRETTTTSDVTVRRTACCRWSSMVVFFAVLLLVDVLMDTEFWVDRSAIIDTRQTLLDRSSDPLTFSVIRIIPSASKSAFDPLLSTVQRKKRTADCTYSKAQSLKRDSDTLNRRFGSIGETRWWENAWEEFSTMSVDVWESDESLSIWEGGRCYRNRWRHCEIYSRRARPLVKCSNS